MPLARRHLKNLEALPRRSKLLEALPKHAVVAELGVDEGGFSNRILRITEPSQLHLIDRWATARFDNAKEQFVRKRFSEEIQRGTVIVHKGDSLETLKQFPDASFDWVYLDTSHRYDHVRQELELSRIKVKHGGIIAGHDFCQGSIACGIEYGVVAAVHEFCGEHDWEMIYLTLEPRMHWSYALRKIRSRSR